MRIGFPKLKYKVQHLCKQALSCTFCNNFAWEYSQTLGRPHMKRVDRKHIWVPAFLV